MSSAISSIELWASAKFIGRECATVNKEFVLCKKTKGENPAECASTGDLVTSCANNVVSDLKTRFPAEFASFVKCLDKNDYRYDDCRSTEKALIESWNKTLPNPSS